jgi:hypothetical protein
MADTREYDKVRREEMWPALEERREVSLFHNSTSGSTLNRIFQDALAVSKYRNLSSRRTPVDQVTTATTDAKGKGKRCLSDEFDRIEANVRAGGNGTGASITRPTEGDRREEAETRVVEPEAVETEAAPEHVCEPSKATGNPRINQNACSNKGIGVVNIQICPVM